MFSKRIIFSFLAFLILLSCARNEEFYIGAINNPKIKDIGGGIRYKGKLNQAISYKVGNKKELLTALKKAKYGQVIFVNNNAKINLSGEKHITIKEGVTLASGRGKNKSKGGLIYTDNLDTYPLFVTKGINVRITGLRIQGPDSLRRVEEFKELDKEGKFYSIPNSNGIRIIHDNCEIDNCEIYGWSHAGVHVKRNAQNAYIHHNFIHHNQRHRLGYGVSIYEGFALIKYNVFNWNRHHIAGSGFENCGYEASYNIVLENGSSHAFDMHGGGDRKDGTNIAGNQISIHHNTFYLKSEKAIVIRGVPQKIAKIYNNEFMHTDISQAFKQIYKKGNVNFENNKFNKIKAKKTESYLSKNVIQY